MPPHESHNDSTEIGTAPQRTFTRFAGWVEAALSSIAIRLVAVVLVAGLLAFGTLGILTAWRFQFALQQQADALGELSELQLANRLDAEAQLARARVEALGTEVSSRLRQIVQREDVIKAVESQNEVAIRELVDRVARTSGFDRILIFDTTKRLLGADAYLGLVELNARLVHSGIADSLARVLRPENSRTNPVFYEGVQEISDPLRSLLDMPNVTVAHVGIDPIFDDFGDLIGAAVAIRGLARTERTLENFTTLANASVLIVRNNEVLSAAGPATAALVKAEAGQKGLLRSNDGTHVTRCVDYVADLKVCVLADASLATASRDEMIRIGAEQTSSLMRRFLASAGITLTAAVIALLLMVRHTTRGLSALSAAARTVAEGNLDVKINPIGVGEVHDLSEAFSRMLSNLRSTMQRVQQLAFFDTVTRLPNREKIRIDAPGLIAKTGSGAFFFLDLDGFKAINDTFGHRAGDGLLKQVADRLVTHFSELSKSSQGAAAAVARIGGDEFIVILPGETACAKAGEIARDAILKLRRPFDIGGSQVMIGTSIGITVFPADGSSYDELLVNADLAMYSAKENGRNSFAFFSPALAERSKARLSLESDLRNAIQNEELTVHYQPKIDCKSGQIRGVEALVRWIHPQSGNIAPVEFLTIAEETGLIGDIDRFVIARSITEIGALIGAGADITLALNVSTTDIENPNFVKDIIQFLHEKRFPPNRLELEVTESVALRKPEEVSLRIAGLRRLGVRFAIDDFGSGYSNLATLARLPFDSLKLDRSLISGATRDPEKQSIVRIALALAQELGFESVAEGVETFEDFKFVAEEGATLAQGHFFSKAIPLDELSAFMASEFLAPLLVQRSRGAAHTTNLKERTQ